ncbi:Homeodomain-like protein, partial [Pelagophyceae sp. CCMP2097]
WTEEEDAVLREGVLRFGTAAWPEVSRHLLPPVNGGPQKRSSADCEARWDAVVKHTAVKGPWLPEEDALLRQLVAKFGPKRWALIASHIPGRAGKQCRERWLNHLDTRVIKSDWTADEDAVLLDAQQRVGNKWSEIARLLPGRAENAVKNRFNSLITKRL